MKFVHACFSNYIAKIWGLTDIIIVNSVSFLVDGGKFKKGVTFGRKEEE